MEPKLGETFEYKGKKYTTVKAVTDECLECAFSRFITCTLMTCIDSDRDDKTNVIFKEVK